jgi:PAS domain S-box-containing protein
MKLPDEAELFDRLEAVLAADSIDRALEQGAGTLAAIAGAAVSAVFLFDGSDVSAEGWCLPGETVDARTRAAFRRDARKLIGTETGALTDPSPVDPRRTFPMASGGRTIGALCCGAFAAPLEPASERWIERALALLAPRFAAHLEAGRASGVRAQYERWFRTLDDQLRVLDRERQKFSAMVHSSDAAVFVADPEGVVRWTNAVLSAVPTREPRPWGWVGLGCSSVCERYGSGAAACGECPVRRAVDGNLVTHHELHRRTPEGPRSHYLTAIPIKGPDGRPDEVMVMIQDVSELESVRRAEQRLQTVIAHAPVVLFALDSRGIFTMSEGHGLQGLGVLPGEVVGRSAYEVYAATPDVVASLQRAFAGEEFTEVVSVGPLTFETRYMPTRNARGEVDGVFGVAIDVSERHQLEQQLRQSQKMEAIGRLAGGVAHDFNNLLAAILGHTELMLHRAEAGHPLRHSLEEVQQAGTRGAMLTRQLLAFSRKGVITPQVLDMNAVVGEMDTLLRRLIGEDIELVTSFADSAARVRMDRGQLEQVIMNLAVNARDALPGGGQLTIEVARTSLDQNYSSRHAGVAPGAYAMVSVSDNGCGMDAETMAHVFEPFFTTKAVGKGTGLGLSTVYAIVQQAGGHVWLYSEPGLGTTFKVYLPEVADAGESDESLLGAPSSLEGIETILLVEDDDSVRALVNDALSVHGYQVLQARNGAEALWRMQNEGLEVDLLITDVVMPQMGGGELAQKLRSVRPGLKFLFMSGYPDDAVVRQGVLEEGAPFIQKPFMLEALARKVRDVLDAASPQPADPARRAA